MAESSQTALFEEFGELGDIQVIDLDVPEPGAGEVLVRLEAVSLSRPDVFYRTGFWPDLPLPATPGWEGVGIVEARGFGVNDLAVGQRVAMSTLLTSPTDSSQGTARQLIVVPADRVVPVPERAPVEGAAVAGFYASARAALLQGTSDTVPQTILLLGAAGAYGSAYVQVASLLGSTVIGTVSSAERADYARSLGAAHTIDHRSEDVVARTLEITDGAGVDMIINHIGGLALADHFKALAPWGTLLMVNTEGGPADRDLLFPMEHADEWPAVRYFASTGFEKRPEPYLAHYRAVLELMAAGELRPPIAGQFSLEEINSALQLVNDGALGRVLVRPNG